jgi:hypothetical protein
MGDCKEDGVKNKVPNIFKHATCGGVHANNENLHRNKLRLEPLVWKHGFNVLL